MVKSCSAFGCSQRACKGVSFHSFPKDPEMRKKWVLATKREKFVHSDSSRLCGKHFQESDFVWQFGKKKLKEGTVPSVFDFPEHLQKVLPRKRKTRSANPEFEEEPGKKMKLDFSVQRPSIISTTLLEESCETSTTLQAPSSSIQNPKKRNFRQPVYFGDYKPENLKTAEAKRLWQVANKQIQSYKGKLKLLRIKQQRLQKKVKSLQDLLSHLKDQNKISGDLCSMLEGCISSAQRQLLLRQLRVTTANKYPEELRTFALTLHFY